MAFIYRHVMWRWVARMKCILDDDGDGDGDKNSQSGSWVSYCKLWMFPCRCSLLYWIRNCRDQSAGEWGMRGGGRNGKAMCKEKNDVRQRAQFIRIHDAMCLVLFCFSPFFFLFCFFVEYSILYCMSLHGFHVRTCRLTFSAFTWISSHASAQYHGKSSAHFFCIWINFWFVCLQTANTLFFVGCSRLQLKSRFYST